MGFGSDFSGVEDFDPNLSVLTGDVPEQIALSQAVTRRFTTPSGGLFYDPSYGLDLRTYVGSSANPSTVQSLIEAEARKEERVVDCTATITATSFVGEANWTVGISCTANTGEQLSFTLLVSAVTVALLTGTGT